MQLVASLIFLNTRLWGKFNFRNQGLIAGGPMQLVASEQKFVPSAGSAGSQLLGSVGSQEPKFAPFQPLAVATSGSSHETHQQKGKKLRPFCCGIFWVFLC